MTIAEQAILIRDTLQDWTQESGGKSFVASSLAHMWETAYQKTDVLRVIVVYMGERIRGDFGIAAIEGRVDREWAVAVVRGRGFAADKQENLVGAVQNAQPLYELIDEAVDICRTIVPDADTCERPVDFKGVRPMQTGNASLDGYLIEFSIGTQRDQLVAVPDDESAIITEQG